MPLNHLSVMTSGASQTFNTCYGAIEFVHTQRPIEFILEHTEIDPDTGLLAAGQNRLKHTILKEVLHADILRALHESDLGKSLVFQGGTALRLCYGNQRYSEDLDFVRSAPLEPTHFEHFKKTLKTSIAERYELDVRISDPKRSLNQRTTDTSIAVHRFRAPQTRGWPINFILRSG